MFGGGAINGTNVVSASDAINPRIRLFLGSGGEEENRNASKEQAVEICSGNKNIMILQLHTDSPCPECGGKKTHLEITCHRGVMIRYSFKGGKFTSTKMPGPRAWKKCEECNARFDEEYPENESQNGDFELFKRAYKD
jgi:predicted RNA-binding Zn-ribbon protein involved in translation (DUF1610 family)